VACPRSPKIAGIYSASEKSCCGVLCAAADHATERGYAFITVDVDPLPLYNEDLEGEDLPAAVADFQSKLADVDAFLFMSPQTKNYSVDARVKNAIDWGSTAGGIGSGGIWKGKSGAIISIGAGAGAARAQSELRMCGVFLDIHFLNDPEVFIDPLDAFYEHSHSGKLGREGSLWCVADTVDRLHVLSQRLLCDVSSMCHERSVCCATRCKELSCSKTCRFVVTEERDEVGAAGGA